MRLLLILLFTLTLRASIMDSIYLIKAKYYLSHQYYDNAIREYLKIQNITDEIKLNIAYSLYKEDRYSQTLNILKSITNPKLNYIRYYDMGNTLVKLGRLDEALRAYKNALKFGRDEDIKYNIQTILKIQKIIIKEDKKATLKPIRKGKDNPDRVFDTKLKDINLTATIDGLWQEGGNIANHLSSTNKDISHIKHIGKNPTSGYGKSKESISFRYWDRKMEQKSLDTLLIPINSKDF